MRQPLADFFHVSLTTCSVLPLLGGSSFEPFGGTYDEWPVQTAETSYASSTALMETIRVCALETVRRVDTACMSSSMRSSLMDLLPSPLTFTLQSGSKTAPTALKFFFM